jgi:DNA-binding CsgD family transcriptional regulator
VSILEAAYYLASYGIGFTALAMALARLSATKDPAERWNAAAIGALLAVSTGMTLNSMQGANPDALSSHALNFLSIAGGAALIWISPSFAEAAAGASFPRWIRSASPFVALSTGAAPPIALALGGERAMELPIYATFGCMTAAIAWSLGSCITAFRAGRARGQRWRWFLKRVMVAGLAILPFQLLGDAFNALKSTVDARLPKFTPLLLASWAALDMKARARFEGAKETTRGAKEAPAAASHLDFTRFNLTIREKEVAALLISGETYKGIGAALGIAPGTVKTHVLNIYQKTGASNKIELIRFLSES